MTTASETSKDKVNSICSNVEATAAMAKIRNKENIQA